MASLLRIAAAVLVFLTGLSLAQAQAPEQAPEPRIALVIGNSNYRAGSLATPANDAGLVAQTLTQAGFDVVGARDLDQEGLRRSFRDFIEKAAASGPDTIAFVYLAGYGLQYAGENYFAPIEASIGRDSSVPIEALRISDFTRALADLPLKARFVVLDAARANPFAPAGQPLAGGLALVEPEAGSLIAFNAAPGTIAPERTGDYGAYAKALSEMLQQGGADTNEIFAQTRLRVSEETRGAQVPWNASRLTQPVVFFERAPDATATLAEAPRSRVIRDLPVADAYATALERDTISGYQEFLSAHPRDPLSPRVEAMLAARREALTWRSAVARNTPDAYWSYLRRYPRGPHIADARRRLSILSAAFEPPAVFDEYDFDVPPPPQEEYAYVSGPVTIFDETDYAPPPPIYFLPPRPREYVELPPPRIVSPGFLPVPVPIFLPSVRPWRRDAIQQPVRLPGGVTPRDPGLPPRFVAPPRLTAPALQPNVQQQIAPRPAVQQRPQPGVQPLIAAPQIPPALSPQQTRRQQFLQQQQIRQGQEQQRQYQARDQQLRSQQQRRDQMIRGQQVQQQRDQQLRVQRYQQQRDQQIRGQRDQQIRAQQYQQQREQQLRGQRDQQIRAQQFQQQREQQMRGRQREEQMRAQQFQQQRAQQYQQQRAQQQQQQMQMQRAQQQQQQMQMQRAQQQQMQRGQQQQQQQMQQRAQQQQMQQMQRVQQQQQRPAPQQQQRPQRGECGVPGKPPCR